MSGLSSAGCASATHAPFGPAVAPACRGGFDFTLLFEQSILSLLPNALFSLLFAAELIQHYRHEGFAATKQPLKASFRATLLLLPVANVAIWLAILIIWCTTSQIGNRVTVSASALSMVCLVFMSAAADWNHRRARRPATSVILYLLLSLGFEAVQTRTLWLMGEINVIAALLSTSVALKLIILVLGLTCPGIRAKAEPFLLREAGSSVLGRALYLWTNSLLWRGYFQVLHISDLGPVDSSLACSSWSERVGQRLESRSDSGTQNWLSKILFRRHRLLPALLSSCAWQLFAPIPPRIAALGFTWAQPFLLSRAVSYSQQPSEASEPSIAYGLIGATAIIFIGNALSTGFYNRQVYRSLAILRASLVGLIHDSALQSSASSTQLSAVPTLVSTDVDRITMGLELLHEAWAGVVTASVGLYVLALYVGWACVAPVILATISTVATSFIGKAMRTRRRIWVEAIQDRVAYIQAVLQNLRTLKFMGLTSTIAATAQGYRIRELDVSKPFRWTVTWSNVSANVPTQLSAALCFGLYIAANGELNAGSTFAALAAIQLLTSGLLTTLAATPSIIACLANFDRLQQYITSEEEARPTRRQTSTTEPMMELKNNPQTPENLSAAEKPDPSCDSSTPLCVLDSATLSYPNISGPALTSIDLRIKATEKILILGRVGSGKSTLLKALMGQLQTINGGVQPLQGPVSYCQQHAWLMKASVRSNIIMFRPFDSVRYDEVLRTCALRKDFSQLKQGDEFQVEDGGARLSGGQKHRIALARALYASNLILLLDDIMSSLDADTEALVMERLLGTRGFAARHGLTVVMTSHMLRHERYASRVVVLSPKGAIDEDREPSGAWIDQSCAVMSVAPAHEQVVADEEQRALNKNIDSHTDADDQPTEKNVGRFKRLGEFSTWRFYLSSMDPRITSVFLGLTILGPVLIRLQHIILLLWVEAGPGLNEMYAAILCAIAILGLLASGAAIGCLGVWIVPASSNTLHSSLLNTVMSSPMYHVNASGVGSLVNRFSQDMTLLDIALPTSCLATILFLVHCISQLIFVAIGAQYVGAAIPVILVAVYLIQRFYLRTSQQIRLLDLEAKAPIYAHLSGLPDGLATIQAFQWIGGFRKRFEEALDTSQSPYTLMYYIQSWLSLTLDLLVAGLAVLLVSLATTMRGSSSGAMFGIAMVNLIGLGSAVQALTQSWTALETALGAVYRVKSFKDESPLEERGSVKDLRLPIALDTFDTVRFDDVSASHPAARSHATCLQNINLNVSAGSKIGICGRTGSGKTSLLACITRLLEIDAGQLTLSDVDITRLPREKVRSIVNALTQDAILLPGTVRSNMFTTRDCSDERLIQVLRKVCLWETIEDKGGLDADINNIALSHGQKQLFRIGSAMLRPTKLLLLDEATSGMDAETEEHVAALLREEWQHATALIVAHRLSTLLHCDEVVVMESGQIVERGPPGELLARDSRFKQLWDVQAGDTSGERNT